MSIAGTYECITKTPMGDQGGTFTVVVDGDAFTVIGSESPGKGVASAHGIHRRHGMRGDFMNRSLADNESGFTSACGDEMADAFGTEALFPHFWVGAAKDVGGLRFVENKDVDSDVSPGEVAANR